MKLKPKHFPLVPPSETALWDWLTPKIDYRILNDLCGWMNYNERENLAGLEALRSEFTVERALGEPPNEILELERWAKVSGLRPGYDERKFHLARAWCCTALLRATAHEHDRQLADNLGDELFPLVESLLALGDVAPGHGLTFVRWLAERWADQTHMVQSHLCFGYAVLSAGILRQALSSLFHVEAAEHASGMHSNTGCSGEDRVQRYLSDLSTFDQNLPRFVSVASKIMHGDGEKQGGLLDLVREFDVRLDGPSSEMGTK